MSFKFFKTFFYIIIILPVYEAGQPLVAGETNRFGIVVRSHSTRYVSENNLARADVPKIYHAQLSIRNAQYKLERSQHI